MCDLVWSPNVPPKTKKCSQKTQMDRLIEKNAIFILLRAMSMHGMSCGHVRSRKNGKRKRAKQWTYYIETLKRTIDCLYEICRAEHCIIGCKEVLMYLTNSVRDFESLIDTINVEISWEKTEKPHSVAWEIRKTTMSPRQIVSNNEEKSHGDSLINMLNFSPVVLCEVVRNAEQQLNASSVSGNTPDAVDKTEVNKENVLEKVECNKENVLDNVDQSKSDDLQDEGWHLVESRHRKRGSSGRSNTSSHSDREDREAPGLHVSSELSQPRKTHMNVYERLTSGVLRPPNPTARQVLSSFSNGGRLTCPRSAMDLPQTKASMAKMAYSRQLLWQKNQTLLEEKLQERRRRDFQFSRKNGGSAPLVSSINFADPVAVTRSAQAFKEKRQKERRLRSAERKSGKSSTSNTTPSLNSIEESVAENEDEAVDNQTEVPVDMSKSDITICDERLQLNLLLHSFNLLVSY
ncbi:hypothetical protein AB6A40_007176 [Gnathostoma spinigerum]|uniref:S phase cyclin A-associated protein in the endoplasmic reticulum N-terminal domain-containing protein n=1 Tax=Gnathostoma spinigerum TaxID=75299 RepID=A0ABD6EV67_9BILA